MKLSLKKNWSGSSSFRPLLFSINYIVVKILKPFLFYDSVLSRVVANCIYFDLFMFPVFVFSLAVAHLGGHRSVAAQGLPVNLQPWPAAASPCVASNYISPRGASVACVCAWLCLCVIVFVRDCVCAPSPCVTTSYILPRAWLCCLCLCQLFVFLFIYCLSLSLLCVFVFVLPQPLWRASLGVAWVCSLVVCLFFVLPCPV